MVPRVKRIILRIVSIEPNGRLVLEGRDRKCIREHAGELRSMSQLRPLAKSELGKRGPKPGLPSMP